MRSDLWRQREEREGWAKGSSSALGISAPSKDGRAEGEEAEAAGFPQAGLGCRKVSCRGKEIPNPRKREGRLIFRPSFCQTTSPSAGLCRGTRLWKRAPPEAQQQKQRRDEEKHGATRSELWVHYEAKSGTKSRPKSPPFPLSLHVLRGWVLLRRIFIAGDLFAVTKHPDALRSHKNQSELFVWACVTQSHQAAWASAALPQRSVEELGLSPEMEMGRSKRAFQATAQGGVGNGMVKKILQAGEIFLFPPFPHNV